MGLPAAYETDIMNRIKAGRIDYAISKPFRFGEIQKAVRYFLDTGWYDKRRFQIEKSSMRK